MTIVIRSRQLSVFSHQSNTKVKAVLCRRCRRCRYRHKWILCRKGRRRLKPPPE